MRPTSAAPHPSESRLATARKRPIVVAAISALAVLAAACGPAADTDTDLATDGSTSTTAPASTSTSAPLSASTVAPTTPTTTPTTASTASTASTSTTGEAENDGPAAQAPAEELAEAFVRFARGDDEALDEIPFGSEVVLVLHDRPLVTVSAEDLGRRSAWVLPQDDYAGFVGPFDLLTIIGEGPDTEITVGSHPHCAGPPLPAPIGFEDHQPISIQPAEGTIDSCIPWYAVDLFHDPTTGTVDAVSLALFGP